MNRRTFLASMSSLAALGATPVPAAGRGAKVKTTSNRPPRKVISPPDSNGEFASLNRPTPWPLPGGELLVSARRPAPLLGGVGGGFMVPMRVQRGGRGFLPESKWDRRLACLPFCPK